MWESGLAIVCVGENCLEGQEVRHLENCEGRDCITKKCGNLGSAMEQRVEARVLAGSSKEEQIIRSSSVHCFVPMERTCC